MNHLSDQQLEDICQGRTERPEHLGDCPQCQSRLAQKQQIAEKLRSAFSSIKPPAGLDSSIREQIASAEQGGQGDPQPERHVPLPPPTRVHNRLWPLMAAAAAIVVVLIPLGIYLSVSPQATAAQEALANIHHQNLDGPAEFYNNADPEKLAQYFKNKLGFSPAFPCTGNGMAIRGCCLAHFKGSIVGSYVVDTPKGVISVIVVTDTPESIGMTQMPSSADHAQNLWKGSFAHCKMITLTQDNLSYCAVAELPHKYLAELLNRLLPDPIKKMRVSN